MSGMRIYVACLASYNNGLLHGRWIDATTDEESMQEEIDTMLAASKFQPAEEWAIHDHEGLGSLGEHAGLGEVSKRVALGELAEDRGMPLAVILEFAEEYCAADADQHDVESELDDRYHTTFDKGSEGDWATEQAESLGYEVPDWLGCHVNWDGVARDWLMDYSQIEHQGAVYLFHNG